MCFARGFLRNEGNFVARVYDEGLTTQFQLCNRNYEVGITQFQLCNRNYIVGIKSSIF